MSVLAPSATASLDAQLLLSEVLRVSRASVLAYPERSLAEAESFRFENLVTRRRKGEPVAYIRGHVSWFGMELEVTRDTLVPRPETELLVEEAIAAAVKRRVCALADVGTGSGAIALALSSRLPAARVYATDTSLGALAVAKRNVDRQGAAGRVTLFHGDLIEPLPEKPDMVVANLPYLSTEMMDELDADVGHEPRLALHGGETGLGLYSELLCGLSARGWTVPVFLEIDPRQAALVHDLVDRGFGRETKYNIVQDYAGHARIVCIEAPV